MNDVMDYQTNEKFDMKNNKRWKNYDKKTLDETFKSSVDDNFGVTYYIAEGEPFNFLIHVIDSTSDVKGNGSNAEEVEKISYIQKNLFHNPNLFINSGVDTSIISCSTISNKGTPTFGLAFIARNPRKIILGFNENNSDNVYGYYEGDHGTLRTSKPTKSENNIKLLGRERVDYTEYDEVIISRKGRKPDYIVSPYHPSDKVNNIYNILWAKIYNIPIIYVNTDAYVIQYSKEVKEILKKMESGVICNNSEYQMINNRIVAMNSMSYSPPINMGEVSRVIFSVLKNNITKENADRFFECNGISENIFAHILQSEENGFLLDIIALHYDLEQKYPWLSKNQIIGKLKESISSPRSKYQALQGLNYDLEKLNEYAMEVLNNQRLDMNEEQKRSK